MWLRLPFDVVQGEMDANVLDTEARIQFKQPFVLRHLYQEGLDKEAQYSAFGGLVNQFQEPVDKDAPVETGWVEQAQVILKKAENMLQE